MGGYGGDDDLRPADGNDRLFGGEGNDLLRGSVGDDYIDGGRGVDTLDLSYDPGQSGVSVDLDGGIVSNDGHGGQDRLFSIEWVSGSELNDVITGSNGKNTLIGAEGRDFLSGGRQNDVLGGSEGADTLAGGAGRDRLSGGAGADTFLFTSDDLKPADPGDIKKTADRIQDFHSNDIIDLSQIDAVAGGGGDAFHFIGTDAFSGTAGELRTEFISNHVYVFGDTNGDSIADLTIVFTNFAAISASDFIL